MTFKAAKCPNCAGDIQVPDDRDSVKCMYCGSDIVVREAIRLAGVNIENLLMLAKTAEESCDWDEAYKYYSKVLEHDSKNTDAWVGKGFCSIYSKNKDCSKSCWGQAYTLSPELTVKSIIKIRILKASGVYEYTGIPDNIAQLCKEKHRYLRYLCEVDENDILGLIASCYSEIYILTLLPNVGVQRLKETVHFYEKAWEISGHDKRITCIILETITDIFLNHKYFVSLELLNQLRKEAHFLPEQKLFVDFINKLKPNDRIVEKIIIKRLSEYHQSSACCYGDCDVDKAIFNRLLGEVQSVDPCFNPGKSPGCLKSGWFS